MPRRASISFGIEFEFDFVNRSGDGLATYREDTHRVIQAGAVNMTLRPVVKLAHQLMLIFLHV